MKKDTYKTPVIFYWEKITEENPTSDIFAFFPNENYYHALHPLFKDTFTCYAHIGQHSGCSIKYANECKQCENPNEYNNLKNELEGLGYNLDIKNQVNV